MTEQAPHDPDLYKNVAAGVITRGDPEELGNTQVLFHAERESLAGLAAETGKATSEDKDTAYDVAWATKPDVDTIVEANKMVEGYKELDREVDDTAIRKATRRLTHEHRLMQTAAEIDYERNAAEALKHAQALGRLASRHSRQ